MPAASIVHAAGHSSTYASKRSIVFRRRRRRLGLQSVCGVSSLEIGSTARYPQVRGFDHIIMPVAV